MEDNAIETTSGRNVLVRILLMMLMAVVYHLCGMILFVVAVAQIVFVLLAGGPNPHLSSFGRSLGLYFQQNVHFLTFVTEELPFPFKEWPS